MDCSLYLVLLLFGFNWSTFAQQTSGIPGFAQECMWVNGSRTCSDPCSNYIVLDQPWRSTSYGQGKNCDSDKRGWYRFVGQGGERMPEACVPIYKCNTDAPLWLDGSHPNENAGIVTRVACAHWNGKCCQWSTSVQVKACIGGYYVYKLEGTPTCSLSYCTDPNYTENPCSQCGVDEECSLMNGVWSCRCSQGFNSSDISSLKPELECGASQIKVYLEKCVLKELGFQDVVMYLKDNRCSGFEERKNTTVISVVTPTQGGQCGTQLTKNDTHATYSNTLYLGNGIVVREDEVKINFQCSYPLDMETSLATAIRPIVSSINISVGGTGIFMVKMALYRDSNYTSPYEGSTAVLSTKDTLYVGVMVTVGDMSRFVLKLVNCYATPTENTAGPLKYFIIQNSCSNPRDSTVSVAENGVASQAKFSVQGFGFLGDSKQVFLHCEFHFCDIHTEQCRPHCSRGESRQAAVAGEPNNVLHLGPIALRGSESLAGAASSHASLGVWITVLVAAVLAFPLHEFA
ncbi:uromodulin-like isoform X2 [Sphaerodactylus townsendi]|uniref:uromodulin-like isoform X2 n=1 Tax=Sphaerodactylus townsendi TaxID=933632 RepID=UPI00202618FC|nr:uromodulin-like isoform X2 [Sphaerodactylus townsendi]